MANISFFRSYKPNRFNYIPRFYDERKEALNERIARIKQEMGVEDDVSFEGTRPRRTLTKGVMYEQISKKRKTQRKSSIRLLIITAILIALAYYMFYR